MSTRSRRLASLPLFALAVAACSTLRPAEPPPTSAPRTRLDPGHAARALPGERPSTMRARSVPASVRRVVPILLDAGRAPGERLLAADPPPTPAARPRPFRHRIETAPAPAAELRGSIATDAEVLYPSTGFDDNPDVNGGYLFIPPDPHMAAGPDHVITVVNCAIQIHDKSNGASVLLDDLAGFFASESPLTLTYDPRVLYDEFEDRWVVVTLEVTDTAFGDATNTSRVLIAVSDDADPTGGWTTTSVDVKTTLGPPTRSYWFDYPGVAIDEEAIYVTGNLFSFYSQPQGGSYGGALLAIVDKGLSGGFYDGGAADASLLDPYDGAAFPDGPTLIPATLHPSAPAGAVGTFLLAFSGLVSGPNSVIGWIRVDDPVGVPALASGFVDLGVNLGSIQSGAPQLGSTTAIDTGDRRILSAVYRNRQLWTTSTTMPSSGADASDATAFWARFDVSDPSAPALGELGTLGAEDLGANTFTSYANVAVNPGGHALFGFAASSSAQYAGAYFRSRAPGDAAGTTGATKLLQGGTDFYVRTFGGGRNRWGDYTGAAVDPKDGCFWVFNEHAATRGTPTTTPNEDGRWETSFGRVCPWLFGDDFERGDLFRWSTTAP